MSKNILAVSLAALLCGSIAQAAQPVSEWLISSEIEGYGPHSISVCLGKNDQGEWQAGLVEEAGPDCHEQVIFDLDSRTAYLAFPGALASTVYICNSGQRIAGSHPCKSAFFTAAEQPGKRRLNRDMLRGALEQANAFVQVEAKIVADHQEWQLDCKRRLESSNSIALLNGVLASCDGAFDYADLAKAANTRKGLESEARTASLKEYRSSFEALSRSNSLEDIEAFISRYETADSDHLVPKARAMLKVAQQRIQIEASKQKTNQALMALENQIAQCKSVIAQAQAAKLREQKIAAASGYTRPDVLRQAAAAEVDCRAVIDESHKRYLELGGARGHAAIQ